MGLCIQKRKDTNRTPASLRRTEADLGLPAIAQDTVIVSLDLEVTPQDQDVRRIFSLDLPQHQSLGGRSRVCRKADGYQTLLYQ